EHDLRVSGRARADLLVGRVLRVAAGVADRGRVDAAGLPELALRAPEAAHAEDRRLDPFRERRAQRRPEHEVALGHRNRLRTPGQRALRLDHLGLFAEEQGHVSTVATVSTEAEFVTSRARWDRFGP